MQEPLSDRQVIFAIGLTCLLVIGLILVTVSPIWNPPPDLQWRNRSSGALIRPSELRVQLLSPLRHRREGSELLILSVLVLVHARIHPHLYV